jgi:hypothetical protein
MTRRTLALLVGAALLAPTAGQAQGSEFARQVGVQLVRDAGVLIPAGFALSHDPYTGTLYDNAYEDLTLTLHSGVSYALVGVCDNDCSDLDLISTTRLAEKSARISGPMINPSSWQLPVGPGSIVSG